MTANFQSLSILSAFLVSILATSASAADTVFTIDEQQSSLTIEASTEFGFTFSDTDTQMLGGTIDATFDFGNAGGFPTTADFTVTGAEVSPLSSFLFTLGSPPNFGVNVSVNDAVADVTTLTPPATLTMLPTGAIRYEFDASAFIITLNQGTVVSTGAVNDTIDLADTPVIGNASPGTLGQITFTPNGMSGSLTMIDAFLELPVQFIEDVDVDGQIVTLDVEGDIFANSSFLLDLTGSTADTEPDGDVDGADFLSLQVNNPSLIPTWQTEYGQGALVSSVYSSTGAVPEPTSLALLLLAAVMSQVGRNKL
ncbi:PEP-CTERM sorting domain-containing protein [Adhaeretor mobilis]|uniref:PEP-CTERM protein-sorting domain-containing protein n=1 Tax=Adhaeretor mobilis TaxID=1930276 RepID=A0A517N377_9BACT|nr:PEP-CTERM sorting domain-containing protein [Adhaeretor mobilis]QDT01586.1 hypothetical protein HG15A2_49330 [Adhaeretor mobilis]